jgi:DNA-binding IclR family transcriptional regulator
MSIQSIERAAAILRCLSSGPRRLGVSELSIRLGLAKGTIHGILKTLHVEGFVEQDLESGKYQIGPALLQLGQTYLDVNELRKQSLVWAEILASKSSESVRVGVLRGPNVLIVHHVFRPDNSLQILEVGSNLPLHATAMGKAILAHKPALLEDLISDGLTKLTRNTIIDAPRLSQELESVREHGCAEEREESVLSEVGLAAPVFDARGEVAGAIGVHGSIRNLWNDGQAKSELVDLVIDAARAISRDLGAERSRG